MAIIIDLYHSSTRVKSMVFNDGSVQVSIPDLPSLAPKSIRVAARLRTPEDQMALIMATSILKEKYPYSKFTLDMPFTPYGRQDQAFVGGEANSMKVWGNIINNLGYDTVIVHDPHSIAVSYINNLVVVPVEDIIEDSMHWTVVEEIIKNSILVSPDAGANKKAHKICKALDIKRMVRADKARDLATGAIIETELYGDVEGEKCLIVDDICDGGRTFIELGKVLKARGAKEVNLFVTHGIFSQGMTPFNGIIDNIVTTRSIYDIERSQKDKADFTGRFIIA